MAVADRLGANLAYCRRRAKLSQEELAVMASLHRTAVGQIELADALSHSGSPAYELAQARPARVPPHPVKQITGGRHSKGCSARDGGRCNCNAGYEAWVFSKRDGKKIRRTFAQRAEAKSWRADALGALARGGMRAAKKTTLGEAWTGWIKGAKHGSIPNRSGDPYKRAALRSYESGMRLRVLPRFSGVRLTDLQRFDLQEFADDLLADGWNPSTIQVTLLPVRAIYRRALSRGEVAANPCSGLQLPAVRGRRERYAAPTEAEALIAAVPAADRPIWATAMYGGLRRGELQALRAEDVDLANGVIRVEFGWE